MKNEKSGENKRRASGNANSQAEAWDGLVDQAESEGSSSEPAKRFRYQHRIGPRLADEE